MSPQGSILGPLLFNIYINGLFWLNEQTEVYNYADDTTLYACDENLNNMLLELEHDSMLAIEWYESNYMKLDKNKFHLLLPGKSMNTYLLKLERNKFGRAPVKSSLGLS